MTYLNPFLADKVRDSNFLGCLSTEERDIAQSGRKVLFVRRKPSEQTG